jgi:hypothetical protein
MPCYTDQYPLLYLTIIQLQIPVTPINIHYCTVTLSSSNAVLHRSIFITVPYHYPVTMPCYTDQYPLLYRTIIQLQCPVTPINIHYCTVPLSSYNALLQRSISITVPTIIQLQCSVTPINIHYCTVPLSSYNHWYFALATFLYLTFRPAQFKQNSHIFTHILMPHVLTVTLNTYWWQHCVIWLIDKMPFHYW